MIKYYTLKILGLTRNLPILKTPSGQFIAGFNCVGDMELLKKAAKNLKKQLKTSLMKFFFQ